MHLVDAPCPYVH